MISPVSKRISFSAIQPASPPMMMVMIHAKPDHCNLLRLETAARYGMIRNDKHHRPGSQAISRAASTTRMAPMVATTISRTISLWMPSEIPK